MKLRAAVYWVWGLCLLGIAGNLNTVHAGGGRDLVMMDFYSARLFLPNSATLQFELPEKPDEATVQQVYARLDTAQYKGLLAELDYARETFGLNDWLYYDMTAEASELLFADLSRNHRVLLQWFLLSKAGYDARIFLVGDKLYLNVWCEDARFGFYVLEKEGKRYVNLTARRDEEYDLEGQYARLCASPVPLKGRKVFSLYLEQLPDFPGSRQTFRTIQFRHKGEEYSIPVRMNVDHVRIMDAYPFSDQELYFRAPLSEEVRESLYPTLRRLTDNLPSEEAVALLLSFTRTAFYYVDDRQEYGREKPMTAEQTLFYNTSDCEDRTALFFRLVTDILDLPVIVLDFERHVGAAVYLEGKEGDHFLFMGKKYLYCEPTGPQDVLKVGEIWDELKAEKASIIASYTPAAHD